MTTPDVPQAAQAQLLAAVDTALSRPQAAQGFLGLSSPDLSSLGEYKDKAAAAVTGILGAIDTIQQYSWLIPSKYHDPIQKLEDALKKVQGWLD